MILDENLFEINEARGSKEGIKRGPYNKEKSKSKEDLYDELQDKLEKEFYFPGVAKGGDLKVNLIMKDENKAELKGKRPARLIASSMSKYRDIKDEKELDTAKRIAKEMGFKTELDKTKKVPTLIIKLEESLNEKKSNRLTYHEFVDYLDSINNGYTGFAKVTGNKGSGYRYTLSNKLTREQHDYLAQYDNVDFGTSQYKYAPEIKNDTVILLDRMPKTSLMKEDYDEDFFYTYEAIRHGESDPNRKYSGDFEDEDEAIELAEDDEYDEVVRYTYDFISDNFDDYWGMPPRRTDTVWTKESGYINEDIVKTSKGKWVNKGKEGTHGEFSTKKKAREQQKAMFAQGFKGESLKEEYGPHKNEPYCEEIADDLENGRWIGETYNGTSWELTINGYSSDEFSPAFAEYLAREVSYPVRDGHLSYRDLDLIINKHDLLGDSNKYIPDLVKIGFDRETIDEWLKIPSQDEEIEIWVDYDLDFSVDDWKINESLDESIDRDSIESDFENITNMSDARERLKKYKIDLIKKDNRNYILRKDGKGYTFYVLDNPNEVRKDLVKAVYKLTSSKRDSSITESKGVIRKYKGYTLHDTGDSITITDPHGKTVGTERTEIGAEGLVDDLVNDKNMKENIGSDIAEYQKWVDYDMKKYGRISSLTNHKVRKAGLEIVVDKYGDYEVIANEPIREDLEREFTIHYNREGFEFGGYGAVRVKATNEDEAKEKFYAEKKDDKITISSIRPTENEDIRKGIRLLETKKVNEDISMSSVSPEKSKINFNVTDSGDFTFTINGKEYKGHTDKPEDMSKDLKDFGFSLTEDVEVVDKNQEKVDKKAGLENLLNDLINDENEAINGYNSAIVNFELEGKSDLTNVFRDIIKDEQNHIGNLQKVLNEINPTTIANLEQGQQEATDTLNK